MYQNIRVISINANSSMLLHNSKMTQIEKMFNSMIKPDQINIQSHMQSPKGNNLYYLNSLVEEAVVLGKKKQLNMNYQLIGSQIKFTNSMINETYYK